MDTLQKLLEAKKREYEKGKARLAVLGKSSTFTAKLRFRLGSRINSEERVIRRKLLGRTVKIRARDSSVALKDSNWVVVVASRFKSIESAVEFGMKLQTSMATAAALRGIAIDVGADNKATASFSDHVKDALAKDGAFLIDDVHGVDVYPSNVTAMLLFGEMTATTTMSIGSLFDPVEVVGCHVKRIDEKARSASLLLNAAAIAGQPTATIVLSIAAVELMASSEKWSDEQKLWIRSLPNHLELSDELSNEQKEELRQAILGMLNFGVRSKMKRLIYSLNLQEVWQEWDNLYNDRSKLFHGSGYIAHSKLVEMSGKAAALSHRILTAYLGREAGVPSVM